MFSTPQKPPVAPGGFCVYDDSGSVLSMPHGGNEDIMTGYTFAELESEGNPTIHAINNLSGIRVLCYAESCNYHTNHHPETELGPNRCMLRNIQIHTNQTCASYREGHNGG